mgnify:CR=1 FL=1
MLSFDLVIVYKFEIYSISIFLIEGGGAIIEEEGVDGNRII